MSLTDSRGQTALHHAASVGNVAVLCALIDAGADVDAKDATECTPLHMAAMFKATDCISHLLARCDTFVGGSYRRLCGITRLSRPASLHQ